MWETIIGRFLYICAFSKELGANFTQGQLCDVPYQTNENGQHGSLGCIPPKDVRSTAGCASSGPQIPKTS